MYITSDKRYETMKYNRCGKSGLMLPAVSLGLWHNFGDTSSYINMEKLCFTAFDNGTVLRTLIWPIITGRSRAVLRRTSAGSSKRISCLTGTR